jgi:hypothetical protein
VKPDPILDPVREQARELLLEAHNAFIHHTESMAPVVRRERRHEALALLRLVVAYRRERARHDELAKEVDDQPCRCDDCRSCAPCKERP